MARNEAISACANQTPRFHFNGRCPAYQRGPGFTLIRPQALGAKAGIRSNP